MEDDLLNNGVLGHVCGSFSHDKSTRNVKKRLKSKKWTNWLIFIFHDNIHDERYHFCAVCRCALWYVLSLIMTLTKANRKDSDGEEKVLTLTSSARRYLETWHWRDSRGKYVSRRGITAYVARTWGTSGLKADTCGRMAARWRVACVEAVARRERRQEAIHAPKYVCLPVGAGPGYEDALAERSLQLNTCEGKKKTRRSCNKWLLTTHSV